MNKRSLCFVAFLLLPSLLLPDTAVASSGATKNSLSVSEALEQLADWAADLLNSGPTTTPSDGSDVGPLWDPWG